MTTSVLISSTSQSNSIVKKYPLMFFFLLAYGLTWPFMIVEVFESYNMLPFQVPMAILILQAFMPGLAAVIVTGLSSGREGIRALFRKLLIVRVEFRWYAFAIFGMAAISAAAIALHNLFGSLPGIPFLSTKMPVFSSPVELLLNIMLLFIFSILFNSEEFGWRGFALPRLQAKYNALTSSLILSVPWLFFHLPLFFKQGSSQADSSFLSYGIGIVATTVLFTWMYNNTRGSLLMAFLLHASSNTWTQIFSINSDATNHFLAWMMTGVLVLLAILVTVMSGAENLSRSHVRIQEEN
ncbi:MAG TPA: CPBP family intramembrane glutamic endopeptidase [Anaerolineales bacterium]|nr:CPBP family intramembrane glutamic endopeptidase [Anaerolineales bacterium]